MSTPGGPPPPDLKDLKRKTQANITTVGQMLEGLLAGAHARAIMHPQTRLPVRDTHLAYALQLRAELAADVWIKHATSNPTLMAILIGFNRLFEGGEETMLFASLALSAMATFGRPPPAPVASMFAGDIFTAAAIKDQEIRHSIAQAQQQYERQQAAAAAQHNGRPTGEPV